MRGSVFRLRRRPVRPPPPARTNRYNRCNRRAGIARVGRDENGRGRGRCRPRDQPTASLAPKNMRGGPSAANFAKNAPGRRRDLHIALRGPFAETLPALPFGEGRKPLRRPCSLVARWKAQGRSDAAHRFFEVHFARLPSSAHLPIDAHLAIFRLNLTHMRRVDILPDPWPELVRLKSLGSPSR